MFQLFLFYISLLVIHFLSLYLKSLYFNILIPNSLVWLLIHYISWSSTESWEWYRAAGNKLMTCNYVIAINEMKYFSSFSRFLKQMKLERLESHDKVNIGSNIRVAVVCLWACRKAISKRASASQSQQIARKRALKMSNQTNEANVRNNDTERDWTDFIGTS